MQQGILGQWWRLGGVFGIGFIVLFIIGGFVFQGEGPTYDQPIAEIREYWENDGQSYLAGDYLIGIGFVAFFVPFLSCLRALLGRAEGEPQIWSRVAFASGIIALLVGAGASVSWGALAFAAENIDDESMLTLMYVDAYAFSFISAPFGIFLLASSLVIWQTGVLWRWLAILGVIVGIAGLLVPLGILDDDPEDVFDLIGFIGFIGLAIWLLLSSIGMLMRKEEPMPVVRREM